jgi:hypothetical protein
MTTRNKPKFLFCKSPGVATSDLIIKLLNTEDCSNKIIIELYTDRYGKCPKLIKKKKPSCNKMYTVIPFD